MNSATSALAAIATPASASRPALRLPSRAGSSRSSGISNETARSSLGDALTPTDAFYVRSHGPVPELDRDDWRLRVHGLVERELSLSLETLREAFGEREVTATLQCAGNRRAGLIAIRDIPGEAPWGPGATGTATWTGIALADVLALAGPLPEAAHVGFESADLCPEAQAPQRCG